MNVYTTNIQGLKNPAKKINLIKFITKFSPSIVCLQETNINTTFDPKIIIPNYSVIYNSATNKSSGTAVFVSNAWTIHSHVSLVQAKLQKVVIEGNNQQFTIYNIHMPHVNSEALTLIDVLENDLTLPTNSIPILCGDWNYVDNVMLDYINHISNRPMIQKAMKRVILNQNLADSFRVLHPSKILMTHTGVQRHKPQGRLDRIYIPQSFKQMLMEVEVLPSISDHAIVGMKIGTELNSTMSYWKMPNKILQNSEFCDEITSLLEAFLVSTDKSFTKYEVLKFQIKKVSLEFCHLQRLRQRFEMKRIQHLYQTMASEPKELFQHMVEMDNFNEEVVYSDHQHRKIHPIRSEITINTAFSNISVTERAANFFNFYEQMCKPDNINLSGVDVYLQDLPKIGNEHGETLGTGPVDEELEAAISGLANGAVPGLDGLSSEFYKVFRGKYVQILKWLWLECFNNEIMPKSLRQGVVSMIYKNKGDPGNMRSWRPITLSNTDFKTFAIIYKNKLAQVLPTLVGPWQTCGINGRSIFDNLAFLRDNLDDSNGALLAIDQENAFPNVDHGYMLKVLAVYGFPEHFIRFIRIMYTNIQVFVNVGGTLTKPIHFAKGIKQGDPMASSLFVLCIEPLLLRLSSKMLAIAPSPFPKSPKSNISAYADDTTPVISDLRQLKVIESELELYGKFSGGRVNWSKCELFPFGNWNKISIQSKFKIAQDGIKILGIYFGRLESKIGMTYLLSFSQNLVCTN